MFFWNTWDKESRIVYLSALSLMGISLIFYFYFYFLGLDSVLEWDIKTTSEPIRIAIDTFTKGIVNFSVEADVYMLTQQFAGGDMILNIPALYIYFAILLFALVIALTTLSFLNNWLYYAGTSIILGYYILQQPNVLFDNFLLNKFLQVLPIFFLGGTSYYFFAFSKKSKFILRLGVFLISSLAYYAVIIFYKGSFIPIVYMVNYAAVVTIVLSLLFIFFIGFEIVYAFLFLISSNKGSGGKNSTYHFSGIFLMYMVNLILQYLHNTRQIQFELIHISPFLILAVSAILGINGFKERSVMFPKLLPFYPFGAVIYISWAAICFATIGYFFSTGNDPLVELFEDFILFTHIGFGIGSA